MSESTPDDSWFGEDPEIVNEFINEALELLSEAEEHLIKLENQTASEENLHALFRCFHSIKGTASFLELKMIESLAHAGENLLDLARQQKIKLSGPKSDIVFLTLDVLTKLVQEVRLKLAGDDSQSVNTNEVHEIVLHLSKMVSESTSENAVHESPTEAPNVTGSSNPLHRTKPESENSLSSSQSVSETLQSHSDIQVQKNENDQSRSTKDVHHSIQAGSSKIAKGFQSREPIRVDAERLDSLIDMVGELVINESIIRRLAEQTKHEGLLRNVTQMHKVIREVQSLSGSLRMMPVRPIFKKMQRVVRDVSKKAKKKVFLTTSGEDTELDKTVIDRIGDPLMHLVRNAVDHGIESSTSDRIKLGKESEGKIELKAFHKGSNIYIEVSDDGRGLEQEKIKKKAVQKGIIHEDTILTPQETFKLICEPGFSTATEVTEISGRGVGMDVVCQNIESMGGTLEIHSEFGFGTRFVLKLPLTLAVIDGLVIKLDKQHYIIPTQSVARILNYDDADLSDILSSGSICTINGQSIPLLRLEDLFDQAPTQSYRKLIIVVETDGSPLALRVDELVGQQQIVIKSLGETLKSTPGISGCAILASGNIGLVIDLVSLIKLHRSNQGHLSKYSQSLVSSGGHTWAA